MNWSNAWQCMVCHYAGPIYCNQLLSAGRGKNTRRLVRTQARGYSRCKCSLHYQCMISSHYSTWSGEYLISTPSLPFVYPKPLFWNIKPEGSSVNRQWEYSVSRLLPSVCWLCTKTDRGWAIIQVLYTWLCGGTNESSWGFHVSPTHNMWFQHNQPIHPNPSYPSIDPGGYCHQITNPSLYDGHRYVYWFGVDIYHVS